MLCALEVVKISILGGVCAEPKEVCVLRGSRTLLSWCCKESRFRYLVDSPVVSGNTGCRSWFKSEPV